MKNALCFSGLLNIFINRNEPSTSPSCGDSRVVCVDEGGCWVVGLKRMVVRGIIRGHPGKCLAEPSPRNLPPSSRGPRFPISFLEHIFKTNTTYLLPEYYDATLVRTCGFVTAEECCKVGITSIGFPGTAFPN